MRIGMRVDLYFKSLARAAEAPRPKLLTGMRAAIGAKLQIKMALMQELY